MSISRVSLLRPGGVVGQRDRYLCLCHKANRLILKRIFLFVIFCHTEERGNNDTHVAVGSRICVRKSMCIGALLLAGKLAIEWRGLMMAMLFFRKGIWVSGTAITHTC